MKSFEFVIHNIVSSADNDSFTSLLICMPFYSFFLPNFSGTTSSTTLNKSGKDGHPCLGPDLRGKVFSFSQLNNTSCGLVKDDSN